MLLRLLLSIWAPMNFFSTFCHTEHKQGLHNCFTVHFCRHFTRGLSISVTNTTDRLFNLAKLHITTAKNEKHAFSPLAPLLLGGSACPRLITRTFDGLKTNVSAVGGKANERGSSF